MYKKNKKYSSNGKMPSIFKKSTSDPGTLSESHRKVLHRCRMMLLKDLEVTDILDYMSQEDGFKQEVRDTIVSYPDRERRVATLLDKLETRGDRAFALFMEALRENYKHLHYVLDETLRNVDDKDYANVENRLTISGEAVRKIIKNSMRRKTEYSQGSESVDDLDIVFDDREEDAYIDCYSIPVRGRLQKERWIKQIKDGYNKHSGDNLDESDDEETSYMAIVLKDLLFKRIDVSEIPDGVKQPPKHCSSVFIIDSENKYGLVKKERKVESTILEGFADERRKGGGNRSDGENGINKGLTLDSQASQEVPDYTAPPPPSERPPKGEGEDTVDGSPPPPLPPKPGNLPPLGFRPIGMKPKVSLDPETQDKDETEITTTDSKDNEPQGQDSPEQPISPPPTETSTLQHSSTHPQLSEEKEENVETNIKPPPRSTSLSQGLINLTDDKKFETKKLPSPKVGSKFLVNKAKFEKGGSVSPPPLSSDGSDRSSVSPPVPPRKYMEGGEGPFSNLIGAGALAGATVQNIGSPTPIEKVSHVAQLDIKINEPEQHRFTLISKENGSKTNSETVTMNGALKTDSESVTTPLNGVKTDSGTVATNLASLDDEGDLEDSDHDLNVEVKVGSDHEEEEDPYSLGVDHIFQANGDVAPPSKDDSQSSASNTTVQGSNATLCKDQDGDTDRDCDDDCDVDREIPVQEEEYEAVAGGEEVKESSPEQDEGSNSAGGRDRSRDSTPYDSEDAKRDSRDASTLDSSFKASADSLNGNTTPGSQGNRSITTDSGIDGMAGGGATTRSGAATLPPRMIIPQRSTSQRSGQMGSRPLPKDPPLPILSNELSDVQILANEDSSSDTDSYYEDIDVLDKEKIPLIDTSERTSVSYLDPKTYFKAIERMAQQGLYRDSTLKRIAIVEEWEASGRALVNRDELVIADTIEAYSLPKMMDNVTAEILENVAENGVHLDNTAEIHRDISGSQSASNLAEAISASNSVHAISASNSVNAISASNSVHAISASNSVNAVSTSGSVNGETAANKDVYSDYRHTTLVYDKVGRAFYMPSQYIKRHGDPMGEPWFYPIEISSHQATLFLCAQRQEGCFIVYRPSSKRRTNGNNVLYNLSVCRGYDNVVHYHIVKNLHGDVMIQGHDHSFLNVKDLVEYFQRNKSQLATKLRRPLREANLPITPGYHYDLKWEISRSHLSLTGKIIGRGNYGVVCAGMYHTNIPVAVKVLQKSEATIQEEDDFIDEAKCLMGLNHDHVVRFVGISCTAKPFFLVYEYLPKGNLRECLQNNVVPSDNIEQLFDLCIQVTSAMYYLESQRFVLHRDLAARNFLVADDLCVKLADFGRARLVKDDNYQAPKTEKIPIKWASPEVLIDSTYSTKSDVFALGIVFWEILSGGQKPYSSMSGEQTAVYVTEGGRLDKPTGCPMDLYNMMYSCWRDNPDERPSFAALYDKLKSKSSIYYSSPIRAEPALPKSKKKDHHHSHHHPSSPVTPGHKSPPISSPLSFASTSKAKVQRSLSQSNKKVKHTVMIETTRSGVPNGSTKDILNHVRTDELSKMKKRPLSTGGSERLMTSGSETSLNSTLMLPGIDDLTRGDKIRKSLRKIMNMRSKRKSNSKLDNVKEYRPTQSMYGTDF